MEIEKSNVWLTNLSDILTASDESLTRSLITLDGAGRELKKAALAELIRREREEAIYWQNL